MKKLLAIYLAVLILICAGCRSDDPIVECQSDPTVNTSLSQTDPETVESEPVFLDPTGEEATAESVSQTEPPENQATRPSVSKEPEATKPSGNKSPAGKEDTSKPAAPTEGTESAQTEPAKTHPTEPDPTVPSESEVIAPPIERPDETVPRETEPEVTEPEPTDPPKAEITYEFKRQVAAYAAQYINQYRGSACTVLPGMSQVAQYRAGQLTRNYGHSTADKREALAYFEYGRYVDATEFGDDPSNSYWDADSAEAICAGFYGTDPQAMGKKIADLIRNSSGHWSYISSSEYSYIGVGVEYREGSEYGWYACIMVGSVNYG